MAYVLFNGINAYKTAKTAAQRDGLLEKGWTVVRAAGAGTAKKGNAAAKGRAKA